MATVIWMRSGVCFQKNNPPFSVAQTDRMKSAREGAAPEETDAFVRKVEILTQD